MSSTIVRRHDSDEHERRRPRDARRRISGRTASNAPRPDRRAGALLFRVGDGPVGEFGEQGSFTSPTSGELYLGVNDDHFPDNAGGYQVVLSRPQR